MCDAFSTPLYSAIVAAAPISTSPTPALSETYKIFDHVFPPSIDLYNPLSLIQL